ncbi:MAG: hypothetical protein WA130_10970 [Candidatus Methanoperedens sp.]
MATKAQLKSAIEDLLNIPSVVSLLQLNSDTIERAYEGYILGLCAEAVRRSGGQAMLKGILTGDKLSIVIFRGGPGYIYSVVQDFCYVSCSLNGKQFEIHLDIEYEGNSGATHEIDVSFYDADSAEKVRSSRRLPKMNNKLIMAFECKFYTNSVQRVGLARGFIGLLEDCTKTRLSAFVSNNASDNLKKYLSNKKAKPFSDLTPLNSDSEDRFIRVVEQELRTWAH